MTKVNSRPVIVTTEYRGVFFGYSENTSGDTVVLKNARCAIRWGTTGGFLELADKGPNEKSKIGNRAPQIELRKITSVVEMTSEAIEAWEKA